MCGSHARANKVFLIRIGLATLQASTLLGTQKVTDEPCEGSNGWESVTKGRAGVLRDRRLALRKTLLLTLSEPLSSYLSNSLEFVIEGSAK